MRRFVFRKLQAVRHENRAAHDAKFRGPCHLTGFIDPSKIRLPFQNAPRRESTAPMVRTMIERS